MIMVSSLCCRGLETFYHAATCDGIQRLSSPTIAPGLRGERDGEGLCGFPRALRERSGGGGFPAGRLRSGEITEAEHVAELAKFLPAVTRADQEIAVRTMLEWLLEESEEKPVNQ